MSGKIVVSKKKKTSIAVIVAILVTIGFTVENHLDQLEDIRNREAYAKLLPLAEIPADADFHQTVDAVRQFINQNSEHNIDEEFYAHWHKHDIIAEKILNHAQNNQKFSIPHLECSSRSFVMESMLQALGYRTRSVDVYEPDPDYPSHTFLDVQDPETHQWHIQDPDYDIFWRNIDTGKRISSIELAKSSLDNIEPCTSVERCGWHVKSREGKKAKVLKKYAGLVVVRDGEIGQRDLFTNAERFSLETPQPVNNQKPLAYCDYRDKNCKGKITVFGDNHPSTN